MSLHASPQHRKRPGQPRLPLLDTQHPRIHLSRTRKYSQNRTTVFKAINIISEQTLWRNNKAETAYTTVGQVSEQGYRKRARHAVRRFRQLLDDALAIGRYIDREVARGRYSKTLLHVDDLPEADQFAQGAWEHLPLSDLFGSYTLDAPKFQPTMQNVELRRRVQVGLNKGEAKNALARAVFLNRLGELRDRSYENQRYRASGLNLVVSAIILWNTVYMERAVQALREDGRDIDETLLRHLSPLGWEHINLTGDYIWQQDKQVEQGKYRSLRTLQRS